MVIYLYHKRHLKTNLNYFGKTTGNPYTYKGSGVYWNNHLRKHGNEVETIAVWEFNNLDECSNFAIEFSKTHDIVKSTNWANLCVENGLDGGDKFTCMSPERKSEYSLKQSAAVLMQWKTRDRTLQSDTVSQIWANRDESSKFNISQKISNTLLLKTKEERAETLSKYRNTVAKRPTIVCTHCGFIGTNIANMNRYHFDRCLKNPNALPRKERPKLTCEHCNTTTDPGNFKKHHGDRCKLAINNNLVS